MTQLSLFETSFQISLSDELVAVNFRGRWEVYMTSNHPCGYPERGSERFSHFASKGESLQCYGVRPR